MCGASSLIPRRRFLVSQGNFQNKGTRQEVSATVLVVLFVLRSFREVLVAFLEKWDIIYPKNHWTLVQKGLDVHSRGLGSPNHQFWDPMILRVIDKLDCLIEMDQKSHREENHWTSWKMWCCTSRSCRPRKGAFGQINLLPWDSLLSLSSLRGFQLGNSCFFIYSTSTTWNKCKYSTISI